MNKLLHLLSDVLDVDTEEVGLDIDPEESPLETVERWGEEKTDEEKKAFIEGVYIQVLVSRLARLRKDSESREEANKMFQ